jgi:hypothetical protein
MDIEADGITATWKYCISIQHNERKFKNRCVFEDEITNIYRTAGTMLSITFPENMEKIVCQTAT